MSDIAYIPRLFSHYGLPAKQPEFLDTYVRLNKAQKVKSVGHTKTTKYKVEWITPDLIESYLVPSPKIWVRKNGTYKSDQPCNAGFFICNPDDTKGLPAGRYVKKLLSWICTEARRNNSKQNKNKVITLPLMSDVFDFMGIKKAGGYYNKLIKETLDQLLGCQFAVTHPLHFNDNRQFVEGFVIEAYNRAYYEDSFLDLDEVSNLEKDVISIFKIAEQYKLWEKGEYAYIRLTDDFLDMCLGCALPIKHSDLKVISGAVEFDFYLWLQTKVITGNPTLNPDELRTQLGFAGSKSELVRQLKKAHKSIQSFWDVSVSFEDGRYVEQVINPKTKKPVFKDGKPVYKRSPRAGYIEVPKQNPRVHSGGHFKPNQLFHYTSHMMISHAKDMKITYFDIPFEID